MKKIVVSLIAFIALLCAPQAGNAQCYNPNYIYGYGPCIAPVIPLMPGPGTMYPQQYAPYPPAYSAPPSNYDIYMRGRNGNGHYYYEYNYRNRVNPGIRAYGITEGVGRILMWSLY